MARLKIKDALLLPVITGDEKIPTGGKGDYVTTPDQLAEHFKNNSGFATDAELTVVDNKLKSHADNKNNPHQTTKAQVGLDSVDNTSDIDKPISNATSIALDTKANKAQVIIDLNLKADKITTYTKTEVDSEFLSIYQNGAALPYDAAMEYAEGAVVVKDGELQKKQGVSWVNASVKTDSELNTWSGRTQEEKNKDFVSLHDYCKCNGTDETSAFQVAVFDAKVQGKELRAFYGTIQLSADCNLREVVFDLSPLGINMASGKKLIVGWNAGNSLSKRQYLGLVKKTGTFSLNPATLTTPTVQLMGSKCLEFKFSQIDYLQLYASTDPTTYPRDASIAYCEITGTLATRLEFATDPRYADGAEADGPSSASQWINSNYFYISRLVAVDIDGSYKHNGNIFYNATIETSNARINIAKGNKNRFMNTRLEGSPLVTFGEAAMGNIIERIWFGTQASYLTYSNVVDNGLLNKVTSVQESMSHKIDVIRLDARLDTQYNGQSGNYGNLSPSRKYIKPNGNSRIIYETKPFLIAPSDILDFYCDNPTSLASSAYIARINFYDADMQPCTDITSDWFATGNFNTINAASGYTSGGFNSGGRAYLSLEKLGRDKVRYMSVMLLASSNIASSASSQISITLNTMRNITELNKTTIKPIDQLTFVVTKPTAFVGKIGDVVQGLDTPYRCRLMVNTQLTAIAVSGVNVVTVGVLTAGTGIGTVLAGDLIGIDLNDNSTHWTSIASLSGLTVTLTAALPSAAAIGNNVYISRLV